LEGPRTGAHFRRLREYEAGLREASEAGLVLIRQLTDGLAEGALTFGDS
jgi:hypothetical protein